MHVVTRESAEEAACLAARLVMQALQAKPDMVLGLATGRTMEPVCAELGRLHRDKALDFSACRSFNLDEYVGLAVSDPRSFRHFMRRRVARVLNIDPARMFVTGEDTRAYERSIRDAGGIDLQLLGIGENGHIGFNEPGTPFDARTHVATLTANTRRQNAGAFGGENDVPSRAITMGIGTILEARKIVLLATGQAKAPSLQRRCEDLRRGPCPARRCSCIGTALSSWMTRRRGRWGFAPDPTRIVSIPDLPNFR